MSSAANLSMDGQFRYIVQWFNEWSELQREDFLPILVEYLTKDTPGAYVNGIVSGLAGAGCADKPMSLFQCRVKLFREWSSKWPEDLKIKLKEKVIELDEKLGERLQDELKSLGPTPLTNGNAEPTAVEDSEEPEVAPVQDSVAPALDPVAIEEVEQNA